MKLNRDQMNAVTVEVIKLIKESDAYKAKKKAFEKRIEDAMKAIWNNPIIKQAVELQKKGISCKVNRRFIAQIIGEEYSIPYHEDDITENEIRRVVTIIIGKDNNYEISSSKIEQQITLATIDSDSLESLMNTLLAKYS